MTHVIACREPGTNNRDRWVMITGEPGNWGPPSNAIYRGGLLEDAVNGLIQARFLHDLVELVAEDGGYDVVARVVAIDNRAGTLRFRVLNHVAGEGKPTDAAGFRESTVELKHRGHGKWAVVDRGSGKVLLDGATKDEAEAFAQAPAKAA